MKGFESFQPGKPVEEIISEVNGDLDRGLYSDEERDGIIAKLETAKVTTLPGTPERQEIDRLLEYINERYGDEE